MENDGTWGDMTQEYSKNYLIWSTVDYQPNPGYAIDNDPTTFVPMPLATYYNSAGKEGEFWKPCMLPDRPFHNFNKLYALRNCRSTNLEALKWFKDWSASFVLNVVEAPSGFMARLHELIKCPPFQL